MKKVIVTAPCHDVLPKSLEAAGFDVLNIPDISYEDLLSSISEAQGLVVTTRIKVDKTLIDAAPGLSWIGRLGSGLELIDVLYAKEKGIKCYSTPEGNCTAVGEYALMLLLSGMRHLLKSTAEVKNHEWMRSANRGTELKGKTLGIIGYGNTGSAFAQAAAGIGMRILAFDKYKSGFGNDLIEEVTQDMIQKEADFISFHVPLRVENIHVCNSLFLENLEKHPYIINTSRGSVISQKDLLLALKSGQISGAALDVLENEQITELNMEQAEIFKELIAMPQVTVTPHIAGYTHEAYYKMSSFLLNKLDIAIKE